MAFLFFLFVLVPTTAILALLWLITKQTAWGKVIRFMWLSLFGLILLGLIIRFFTSKKELSEKDYYGEYIIDRKFYRGKSADWQYNTFRFEIRDNDSIYFYVTNEQKVLRVFKGTVKTTLGHVSERLIVNMDTPTYHIVVGNPTTYRGVWDFYLVFHSDKFNNVFFRKGKWKPL